jgi:hypothetical protein
MLPWQPSRGLDNNTNYLIYGLMVWETNKGSSFNKKVQFENGIIQTAYEEKNLADCLIHQWCLLRICLFGNNVNVRCIDKIYHLALPKLYIYYYL